MPPPKSARNGHDDSKSETPNPKEKNGHSTGHQSNGKLRRVASTSGSNLRDATNTGAPTSTPSLHTSAPGASGVAETPSPGLQWPAFEREVLHAYRRAYRLNTPTAFSSDYHQWVLTQRGSVGLYSPTIARRKEFRRQTRDQLTGTVRKHFNALGVVENDIIVDFLHKIRSQSISKGKTTRRAGFVGL